MTKIGPSKTYSQMSEVTLCSCRCSRGIPDDSSQFHVFNRVLPFLYARVSTLTTVYDKVSIQDTPSI